MSLFVLNPYMVAIVHYFALLSNMLVKLGLSQFSVILMTFYGATASSILSNSSLN